MQPIFHWTPRRIKAHIALCFMALVCVRTIRIPCKPAIQKDESRSHPQVNHRAGGIHTLGGNVIEMDGSNSETDGKAVEIDGNDSETDGKTVEMDGNDSETDGNIVEMDGNNSETDGNVV